MNLIIYIHTHTRTYIHTSSSVRRRSDDPHTYIHTHIHTYLILCSPSDRRSKNLPTLPPGSISQTDTLSVSVSTEYTCVGAPLLYAYEYEDVYSNPGVFEIGSLRTSLNSAPVSRILNKEAEPGKKPSAAEICVAYSGKVCGPTSCRTRSSVVRWLESLTSLWTYRMCVCVCVCEDL